MKPKLNSLTLTAAVLTLSAAAAYGQNKVVANIPFSFRTAAGVQAAGEYSVAYQGVAAKLINQITGKTLLAGIGTPEDVNPKATPKVVFVCGSESGCALSAVTLTDGRTLRFKTPYIKPSETARVAVIPFESRQAE